MIYVALQGMPHNPAVEDDVNELIQLVLRFFRNVKSPGQGAHDVRGLLGAAHFGPRHLPVLVMLAISGPESVGELAGRVGLSPATVSQLVNELERGGFVDRREDPRDRRRTIVSLSEAHRRPIEDYARRRLEPLWITMEALAPDERAHFIKGWRILVQAQEHVVDIGPDCHCAGHIDHMKPMDHARHMDDRDDRMDPADTDPVSPGA
jgi:DNA-binding MarR family transcriptional regulator